MAKERARLVNGVFLSTEASGTFSSGDFAPLWLSSNKYGMVSPYANSGYERVGVFRPIEADSSRKWRIGYGLDLTLSQNAQSTFFIQQAFADFRYKAIGLRIGQKQREVAFRNNNLTSGGLSLGINARPLPMIDFYTDYFRVAKWWKWRVNLAYGWAFDGSWQKDWIGNPDKFRYTSNYLYHEKSLFWRFGREDKFPLFFDIGLQMQCQFGGTTYNPPMDRISQEDHKHVLTSSSGFDAYLNALIPFIGAGDPTDGSEKNVEGNVTGSYIMALTWKDPHGWQVRGYFERFMEDHSQLTVQYGIYDHLLGVDAILPKNRFVSHALVEHLSTKDQAGSVYHDPTDNMPLKIAGRDNYYNHHLSPGWSYYGMSMGTPLLISPIYNETGNVTTYHKLSFLSNRTRAWHLGLDGNPTEEFSWKILATWTRDWGCYDSPYEDVFHQQHYLFEVGYAPRQISGWDFRLSVGISHADKMENVATTGNTTGVQLTVRKEINL